MAATRELTFGNRKVALTNLDKVFYPETGFTKGDVVEYYRAVADVLLPHLKDRPVTLKRYPDGVDGQFFYEKECPRHRPPWIRTFAIQRKRDHKDVNYCLLNARSDLAWAANLGNLELHVSLDRKQDIDRPLVLVFDLDPGEGTDILDCAGVALRLRELLAELGLDGYVKVSGSKGLHFVVPLNTKVSYEQTNPFARAVAQRLQEEAPDEVVSNMRKDLRAGKVLVDWSQNNRHKTTVCVYSLRARARPFVSVPVAWEEIDAARRKGDAASLRFDAGQALRRLERHGDLFQPVLARRQRLPSV